MYETYNCSNVDSKPITHFHWLTKLVLIKYNPSMLIWLTLKVVTDQHELSLNLALSLEFLGFRI